MKELQKMGDELLKKLTPEFISPDSAGELFIQGTPLSEVLVNVGVISYRVEEFIKIIYASVTSPDFESYAKQLRIALDELIIKAEKYSAQLKDYFFRPETWSVEEREKKDLPEFRQNRYEKMYFNNALSFYFNQKLFAKSVIDEIDKFITTDEHLLNRSLKTSSNKINFLLSKKDVFTFFWIMRKAKFIPEMNDAELAQLVQIHCTYSRDNKHNSIVEAKPELSKIQDYEIKYFMDYKLNSLLKVAPDKKRKKSPKVEN